MEKAIAAFLLCIIFNVTMFAQTKQTPIAINGALQVKNGIVVNKNGMAPQLRGISFSWSLWQGRKYYNPAVVDWLSTDFKVSIIRAAMGVQPAHGYLKEPAAQAQLMINVIEKNK